MNDTRLAPGKQKRVRGEVPVQSALPLHRRDTGKHLITSTDEQPSAEFVEPGSVPLEPARSLTVSDISAPQTSPLDLLVRAAYRWGVPGHLLAAPFSKPAAPRLLAQVATPLSGDRATGVALRAGYFQVHGLKAPVDQLDMGPTARLSPPFRRMVHGFSWLRDLSSCAAREQCVQPAQALFSAWIHANPDTGKGAAWDVELTGHRLLAWLMHAPLLLTGSDTSLRAVLLEEVERTAAWLDRHVRSAEDKLGEVAGWCAITAAGLLLSEGRPRRLYGEAGLFRALGELVSEDGGVLSRSPVAQMDTIALLVDLRACYQAVECDVPPALETMLALLVPPLLALRHGDGGLGSWQGGHAVSAERLGKLIEASGVRTRPLKDSREWGYQRVQARGTVLQFDAAPPPKPKHARFGCASTLAFELSAGPHRLIVNCGGAAVAGGNTPVRIEQGLRATAAHSTLVLDDANSTAVLIKGQIGKGVEQVAIRRGLVQQKGGGAVQLEASHDGYASRFGLLHQRTLTLRDDGTELRGEDVLLPTTRKGKRGKIGLAIRFHLGPMIEATLSDDLRGASLACPDGSLWQFRVGGLAEEVELDLEESLWVDGQGRPRATHQLVITGMTSRSGGVFPWLFKKMI
ncbi:heparinase II/III family protein [Porphyrobacter sp. GA68]|uniref:heparinase II/III family protein n=1 Tax=Porphyrobacter sp. GA68 TaxID=2883480 RepID=UPI001D182D59|nr:heparinase II/III family protein [Porphyrobacter sp. GA68]